MKKKIIPNSTIRKEVENLTPLGNKEPLNSGYEGVRKNLFTEEQSQAKQKIKMFFVTTIFPLLAVGVYAVLTGIENFNLFTAIGIFTAVALLCFCSMKLIENDKENISTHLNIDIIESSLEKEAKVKAHGKLVY